MEEYKSGGRKKLIGVHRIFPPNTKFTSKTKRSYLEALMLVTKTKKKKGVGWEETDTEPSKGIVLDRTLIRIYII